MCFFPGGGSECVDDAFEVVDFGVEFGYFSLEVGATSLAGTGVIDAVGVFEFTETASWSCSYDHKCQWMMGSYIDAAATYLCTWTFVSDMQHTQRGLADA